MERGGARRLSREFKLAALARMAAGENVSALSRELGVRRKLLYQWRDTVRQGGAEALRGVGRPPAAERLVRAPVPFRAEVPAAVAVPDELARAQAQIAALERKIGQQVLELDFFGHALQLMEQVGRAASAPPDAPASTASSRPGRSGKAG
jgi:transposase-like protein